jgi:GNAT superfamily N-acetyltransferase
VPNVDIRLAVPDDADAICDAHVAGWRAGYAHVFPAAILDAPDFDEERRSVWRSWRPVPGVHTLVPVVDGVVVGFSTCGPERPRPIVHEIRGEVWAFYLHPDHWGTGIADELLVAAEDRLRRDGFPVATLWVLDDNPRARRFYERTGWAPSGRSVMYDRYCDVQVPEVEYRKVLT